MSDYSSFDESVINSVMAAVSNAVAKPFAKVEPSSKERNIFDWNLAGFGGRARVGTTFGDLPIEALRVRDEVRTASGKIARVEWIDKLHLDEDFMAKHPEADPVKIKANAFGPGKPMQDMIVSPSQKISADAHVAVRFKTAADLCSQVKAQRVKSAGMTYYRFHCGEQVSVRVEGIWVQVG